MLSIIIPTLNEEKYLPQLLDSIKMQDFSDYEIIVSDAGSTDRTMEIAKKYGATTLIFTSIKHPSAQRNEGAKIARGDILLFLDADTVLTPGFLARSLKEFNDRKLSGAAFYIKFNPNRWQYNLFSFFANAACFLKQKSKHAAAIGAAILVKRDAHIDIKGFDLAVALSEDCDYCSRLSAKYKFRMLNNCHLLYSARRIEKEGFIKVGLKWFLMGLFTIFNKRIKKNIVKYDFGKF